MPTLPDLSKVSRRDIRYVLICLQNKTEIVKPEHQALVPALEKFLADNGRSIGDFMTKWDLGIDTIDTMQLRVESWWLWGMSHLTIVDRPADSANVPAGLERIFAQGFGHKGHVPPFTREDFAHILEDAATRKGWA